MDNCVGQYRSTILANFLADRLKFSSNGVYGRDRAIPISHQNMAAESSMAATISIVTDKKRAKLSTDSEAPRPTESESATEKVTDTITQGIRAGVFVPGQHLLEPDLTRRLGISRGSLRESLKHLAAAGIVTLTRYRGAYIGILDRKSVLDLLDTLEPLARLAARLAAKNCTSDIMRAKMLEAAVNIDAAGGNRAQYLEYRRRFYDTMIDIGGNRELARAMPLSRTDLFRAQIETVQTEQQRKLHASGYSKIANAIVAQDADAADRAVKKHFDGTRKTMLELPDHAFPTTT
jgi:DNA-binding GntR family transcriptional regulator